MSKKIINLSASSAPILQLGVRGHNEYQSRVQLRKALGAGGSKGCKIQTELEEMTQTHTLSLLPCISHGVFFVELRQSFPSQVQAISPFVERLIHFIAKARSLVGSEIGYFDRLDIGIALHEALANAIVHGNQEDPDRRVYIVCRCTTGGEVSITVQDEGRGFDSKVVPDPTTPENRLVKHGRGIYLMKMLMDEVRFERGGALVYMRKKPRAGTAGERKAG
ncbi:ATP-binding protein [Alloacidobacterium dinghuense]|uniref:ATP-binding protein n=1 Tax=Alloacidobacterium dinghuense TaxID=2763107 RepID=A0A7G8BNX6_9BACT|nr:ATP-binding protein [Alloacidobacterium dinghuense]QNI34246.1 ATP-binding protein [Alloacidobacterium dinghuense]